MQNKKLQEEPQEECVRYKLIRDFHTEKCPKCIEKIKYNKIT